ncbi:MAG: hypothetical protein A3J38_00310 [Gammaproteobacteria bacterium RIFCSPHIGHO2_12_FULL_45_9]|nr:MAG: hypothetical protein A3J38_00310 [Gammaproteobacteria bacterium RIFCSPHIGHO2_12_FULL_45_9]
MTPHWIFSPLYSDLLLYIILGCIAYLIARSYRAPYFKSAWKHLLSHQSASTAIIFLICYFGIGCIDSIHFKTSGVNSAQTFSLLDVLLQPFNINHTTTYSEPLATHLFTPTQSSTADGKILTLYQPIELKHTAFSHNARLDRLYHALLGSAVGFFLFSLSYRLTAISRMQKIPLLTFCMLLIIGGTIVSLATRYHVLGTDKIGQDIFYTSLKSIRTSLMIGTLTTLCMLPLSIGMGLLAGYKGGLIDDVIQYVYTTLSAIPGVLFIAASILVLQVYIESHTTWFPTLEMRADMRLIALCLILGITSWSSLCRFIRAETLKIKELDFIQFAVLSKTKMIRILWKHILPNVFHIVIITVVLDFSGLVLAEAVLSYVGVGVDPTTFSFGNMINSARLELAQVPIVWWPLTSALVFMFFLVLAANLLSDVVRDALDPRQTIG